MSGSPRSHSPASAQAEPRPRLLYVSPLPPPPGGIASWMAEVLASPLGHDFELRVVDSAPSEKGAVAGTSRLRLDRVLDAGRILARLLRELVRFRPRIVHVNTSYGWAFVRDGLAVWLASAFGARTLLHFRGGDFPEFVRGTPAPYRRFIEATLARCDRLIALTHATREYLESVTGPRRVRYVPNFVQIEDFGDPPDRSAGDPRPVEVLFVGWMLPAKGVRELLAAARALPEARFTLVGPEEPAFVASIRDDLALLGPRVRLLGALAREDVLPLYREADVFALPTWREGFPNVVLEAMAAGLPVVATPVGAIPDAVRDGKEGLLVPPRDAAALEAALRRLCEDPSLRRSLGAFARRRAELLFARGEVLSRLALVYRELLDQDPPLG